MKLEILPLCLKQIPEWRLRKYIGRREDQEEDAGGRERNK
jgi:hypothetical protein